MAVTRQEGATVEALGDGAAFVDGDYVPIGEARLPLLDWGFTRSDATYDVVHVWKGSFFRLDDHLDRFRRSCERLRLDPGHGRDAIRAILMRCVRLSGLRDAYVEMICTRGVPATASRDPRRCRNRFFAFAIPFVWIVSPQRQKQGAHLIISDVPRIDERILGNGRPGPLTTRIREWYWHRHEQGWHATPVDYDSP